MKDFLFDNCEREAVANELFRLLAKLESDLLAGRSDG